MQLSTLTTKLPAAALMTIGLLAADSALGASAQYTGSGADAAAIQGVVDDFRAALGDLNAPAPENNDGGRRQINWDGAPDAFSAPNDFPGDFFNFSAAPRARGIEFMTPGTGFQLSATAASGEGVEFSNLNPSLDEKFATFSPERLFAPLGSVVTDVYFFDPVDQETPALSTGFGAVFTDVDLEDSAWISFYGPKGQLLDQVYAPAAQGDETLSFVGVMYDEPLIASVRIYSGTTALDAGIDENVGAGGGVDLVALDDFIFGEPTRVPEPSALLVAGLAAVGLSGVRRRLA